VVSRKLASMQLLWIPSPRTTSATDRMIRRRQRDGTKGGCSDTKGSGKGEEESAQEEEEEEEEAVEVGFGGRTAGWCP